EGYISPARHDKPHVGASFRCDRLDTEPTNEENPNDLQLIGQLSPALARHPLLAPLDADRLPARAARRCPSPDYLPAIAPVVDAEAFRERYAELAKDASRQPTAPAPWYPGLYINAGHGSRGMISCPLSGELIAAWL